MRINLCRNFENKSINIECTYGIRDSIRSSYWFHYNVTFRIVYFQKTTLTVNCVYIFKAKHKNGSQIENSFNECIHIWFARNHWDLKHSKIRHKQRSCQLFRPRSPNAIWNGFIFGMFFFYWNEKLRLTITIDSIIGIFLMDFWWCFLLPHNFMHSVPFHSVPFSPFVWREQLWCCLHDIYF